MSFDGFSWYVTDFDSNSWKSIQNGSFIDGRSGCCGLLALSHAFREQYPEEHWGNVPTKELLRIYNKEVTFGTSYGVWASDEEMQEVVNRLTGGGFALVVPQSEWRDSYRKARRVGDNIELQEKYASNLYLNHIWPLGCWEGLHWEPMRRTSWPCPRDGWRN